MHFVMGIFWLAAGFGLIAYEQFTGRATLPLIRGTEISGSWLMLLLGAYNFVRGYSTRAYRATHRELYNDRAARLRQVRYRERPAEPDPNIDFSDKPSSPPAPGND
jgi:hypothetical protein